MATRWQLCVCSLGLLLLVPCALAEKVSLAGSRHPVMGFIGQDVVLPCQLSPAAGMPSMDVQWRKIDPEFIVVHEYLKEGTHELPGQGYQTRTELFLSEFHRGNISLKLKRLQVADAGQYRCFARSLEWSLDATTELRVTAVAPVFIHVLGLRSSGIELTCRSAGWFPKPELQWIDKNQQNLSTEIVTDMIQDKENLYSVESHVTVTEEDKGDISCIVRNSLLETERQSAIHLSSDVFPRVSPWLAAFWALFALVLIAAGACAYLRYTVKRKASQKKHSEEKSLLTLENEKKILETDRALTELGFRRARSYMVPVTLDTSHKHPELAVSEDGRRVCHKPPPSGLATSGILIAVGREGFVARRDHGGESGVFRWYWEVQVGDSLYWELGLLSATVRDQVRQEGLESFPKEGCWSLRRSGGRYHPSEADTVIQSWAVKPTVVGVFLDLKEGSLSFYSVNSMALILELPVTGSERLFPFLSPGHTVGPEQGKPLSICPHSNWDFPQTLMVSGGVCSGSSRK
ncbi:butyrophilin-like protein 9 [Pelodiscus sinensis]|uniref:butyrophilin-like protein 9 n=1 Tax=Pelodiscus sinensis TaxID=13735 RepID=UPI003F6C4E32